jgi:hypothetical protein
MQQVVLPLPTSFQAAHNIVHEVSIIIFNRIPVTAYFGGILRVLKGRNNFHLKKMKKMNSLEV